MSSRFRSYPNVMQGLVYLGGPRLREIAAAAGVSLAGVHPSPGAVAGALRDRTAAPEDLAAYLTPADIDTIGARVGLGARPKGKVDYAAAVLAKLFERKDVPQPPAERPSRRDPSAAAGWPELASRETWAALGKAKQRSVTKALAAALGPEMRPLETSPSGLACIQDESLGLPLVAVPGGQFTMGLSDAERHELTRLARNWDEESRLHVRDLAEIARPAHAVSLPAFLCTGTPLMQGCSLAAARTTEAAGPGVLVFAAGELEALCSQSRARLLTEAEWEYLARAGGVRSWLAGGESPDSYARRALAEGLAVDAEHPLGVRGLAWGSWVEDGWHAGYKGAPADGSGWEPRHEVQVCRGGALSSFPWQNQGEQLLLHACHRERAGRQRLPVLLARDLPARR